MTIRGILFDKDGTLLDFEATWQPILRRAALTAAGDDEDLAERLLTAGGLDPESGRVRAGSALAAANRLEIAELWAAHMPATTAPDLAAALDRIFEAGNRDHPVPLADLGPVLSRLKKRGLTLGLATSDSARGARAFLEALAIAELFDFVAGYDSGHGVKPGPGMARAFSAALGLTTREIAVVGDNRHDLEMGRAAGAGLVVGVLSGNGAPADLEDLADRLLADVTRLEALLDSL